MGLARITQGPQQRPLIRRFSTVYSVVWCLSVVLGIYHRICKVSKFRMVKSMGKCTFNCIIVKKGWYSTAAWIKGKREFKVRLNLQKYMVSIFATNYREVTKGGLGQKLVIALLWKAAYCVYKYLFKACCQGLGLFKLVGGQATWRVHCRDGPKYRPRVIDKKLLN